MAGSAQHHHNDQDMVRDAIALARELGTGWHTHCSERKEDPVTYVEEYGIRPVEWLYKEGLLGPEATLAHGIYLDDDEIDHVGETGTGIAYCPISHQYIALGVMPMAQLRASGAPIGLGTDGPCCNHRQDMFEVMKQAILLQRVHTLDPTITNGEEALEMATREGARYAGIDAGQLAAGKLAAGKLAAGKLAAGKLAAGKLAAGKLAAGKLAAGKLAAGKLADIIVVDMEQPHLTPRHRTVSALTYSARGSDVVYTIIDGTIVYEDGSCTLVDEVAIMDEAQSRSEELIARAGLQPLLDPWRFDVVGSGTGP